MTDGAKEAIRELIKSAVITAIIMAGSGMLSLVIASFFYKCIN